MSRASVAIAIVALLVAGGMSMAQDRIEVPGTRAGTLGIDGTAFTLDGEDTFLLGISYYAALGAATECVDTDLSAFSQAGLNWVRVWATWDKYGDVSAVDSTGAAREPYLTRLKELVEAADRRGMVVDVTLKRAGVLTDHQVHLQAVRTLAQALKPWRNVYFDVANERNVGDARHVSLEECGELRDAIKEIDPERLITASQGSDISREELAEYLRVAKVDFITPHRPRDAEAPSRTEAKTEEYLQWMAELDEVVPVHYQEPFRRDYRSWQPELNDFMLDLRGAIAGGAAGWCLHNGSPKPERTGPGDESTRRSFDLSERCLMAQLDAVEFATLGGMSMAQNRIEVSETNPRYWSYAGETVMLLGGSDEDNLFNDPEMMADNLGKLVACGGNYIRGTLSWRDENNVPPFEQTGDKYDLTQPSAEFFGRLETCCRECEARGIIMQIEVWATFDFYRDLWLTSPWNPANNVNYSTEDTKLETEWPHHPAKKPQPFFFSVPEVNNDEALLGFQQAFVRKVLDVTLPFGNVLYCMDNETHAPAEWGLYWGAFIRDEAAARGVPVNTTEMWNSWDIGDEQHRGTWGNPEVFNFCDISQNNWQVGQAHYDKLIWYRENLLDNGGPRPMNNVKIYGVVGNSRNPIVVRENIERFWRIVFAGCAGSRFHRPRHGLGIGDEAQRVIRAARNFTDAFDLFACEPRPDLLADCADNECYVLADPAGTFALYFPAAGEVTLTLGDERARRMRVRWFDPQQAEFTSDETVECGATLQLKTPGDATSLALVEAQQG